MIIVMGSVEVRAVRLEDALRISQAHVARSRAEPGCLSHAVYRDTENLQRLVFVEQWADQAALDQHFKVPASRQFVKELGEMATSPPTLHLFDAKPVK